MACQSPIYRVPSGGFREVPVPCGRCPPCLKRHTDGWVFRLMQQEKISATSHFITLTYDGDHVPISHNGFMTLLKDEFPRFMKRLRKLCPQFKVSYYCCGEYGTNNKRPHYHAIVFNVPDDSLFFKAWSIDGVSFGSVHVGQVSGQSIAYCTKYMHKRQFRSFHGRDDRLPEFSLMSKGLGANYVTPAIIKYHNADLSRNYLTVDGGNKIALPRYYIKRIYSDSDDLSEERRLLAHKASVDYSKTNRDYFERKYGHMKDAYTYEQFCEDQRMARIVSFKTKLKDRDV